LISWLDRCVLAICIGRTTVNLTSYTHPQYIWHELASYRTKFMSLDEVLLLVVNHASSSPFESATTVSDVSRMLFQACRSQRSQTITTRVLENKRNKVVDSGLRVCRVSEGGPPPPPAPPLVLPQRRAPACLPTCTAP
jgi:hypothetical protein